MLALLALAGGAAGGGKHGEATGGAQRHGLPNDPQDALLAGIGVDERLGARVPTDLPLVDPSGNAVRLGDYLKGGPALLTLNYFTCPMLCPLTFKSLAATMNDVETISVSKDYRVVTVSFNPEEDPRNVRARADETHRFLPGLADADDRWPFLRGSPDAVRRLTESVGFRYRKVGTEYAHPNVTIVLTPEGVVSRYLYGVEIAPMDLRLALIEAAGEKSAHLPPQIRFLCIASSMTRWGRSTLSSPGTS